MIKDTLTNPFKTDVITLMKISAAEIYFQHTLEQIFAAEKITIQHVNVEDGEILHVVFTEKERPKNDLWKSALLRLNKDGNLKVSLFHLLDKQGHIDGGVMHFSYDAMQNLEIAELLKSYFERDFEKFGLEDLPALKGKAKTFISAPGW